MSKNLAEMCAKYHSNKLDPVPQAPTHERLSTKELTARWEAEQRATAYQASLAKPPTVVHTVTEKVSKLADGEQVGKVLAESMQMGKVMLFRLGNYLSDVKRGFQNTESFSSERQHCLDLAVRMENKETFIAQIPGKMKVEVKDGKLVRVWQV